MQHASGEQARFGREDEAKMMRINGRDVRGSCPGEDVPELDVQGSLLVAVLPYSVEGWADLKSASMTYAFCM